MPGKVPYPTPIYHITHTKNLAVIMSSGAIVSKTIGNSSGLAPINIAHQDIQDRRGTKEVPCCLGGCLHDYVPFYFAPRSPMLLPVSNGRVVGYADGQKPIVHLVSSAQAVAAAGHHFAFTDGHAVVGLSQFWDDLNQLPQIDWDVMPLTYWADTLDDPDRKRRRQAEFLVHGALPWGLVTEIGVIDSTIQTQVQALLESSAHKPPVIVRRGWYYQ